MKKSISVKLEFPIEGRKTKRSKTVRFWIHIQQTKDNQDFYMIEVRDVLWWVLMCNTHGYDYTKLHFYEEEGGIYINNPIRLSSLEDVIEATIFWAQCSLAQIVCGVDPDIVIKIYKTVKKIGLVSESLSNIEATKKIMEAMSGVTKK